jgi:ubiquinone/menaquinone biosynthesis C-methylase UbiE
MASDRSSFTSGEFFAALNGFAALRRLVTDPDLARPRLAALAHVVTHAEDAVNAFEIPVEEHAVGSGYTLWAATYDGPNPAIRMEEPVVHGIVERLPVGRALDAACGTGRHAVHLHARGWDVVGVDANPAMLDRARAKAPEVRFETGQLLDVPLPDASVDLAVCSLALTHVAELEVVVAELARVVRPGGTVVLSDIHPTATLIGGTAAFPHAGGLAHVRNLHHPLSRYLRAARAAGLRVEECVEVESDDELVTSHLAYRFHPDAVRQAFDGMPFVVVWELRRPDR